MSQQVVSSCASRDASFKRAQLRALSEWPGVGAVPGDGFEPDFDRGGSALHTPARATESFNTIGYRADWGRIYAEDCCGQSLAIRGFMIPSTGIGLDPMDPKFMWNPPTSGTCEARDPWQVWAYIGK